MPSVLESYQDAFPMSPRNINTPPPITIEDAKLAAKEGE